jgi:hypothetical protein
MAYNSGAVSDDAIGHKKPITLQTGRALRDNPIEIASGGFGAPITEAAWHAYDAEAWGDGADGLVYDYAVDGAVSTIDLGAVTAGYEYRVVYEQIRISTATTFRYLYFDIAVGGTYRAIKMLDMSYEVTGEITTYGVYRHSGLSVASMVGFERTAYSVFSSYSFNTTGDTYTTGAALGGVAGTNGVGIAAADTAVPTSMRLRLSGSTLSAGKIWLHKRKVAG